MPTVQLTAGPIDYLDTAGTGRVVVFTHGFPMNAGQWRKVIPLMGGYRCVAPTLPLGAHRHPMRPGTALGHRGQVRILAEFLDALELTDVVLVMNDWGGPQLMVAEGLDQRIGAMVLVACEAFENMPPASVRPLQTVLRMPAGPWLLTQLMRTRAFRYHRRAFGPMSRSGIPAEVLDDWFAPALRDRAVRADLAAFGADRPDPAWLRQASAALAGFDRPALVVWAGRDHLMPRDHGPRLASLLGCRLVVIEESATLIPEDQPEQLAAELTSFLGTLASLSAS